MSRELVFLRELRDQSGPSGELGKVEPCGICGRYLIQGTTQHHLIPRTCHRRKWFKRRFTRVQLQQTVDVCRDCHSAIHQLIPDEKELGQDYNTVETLSAHPQMQRFIAWVKKQK